MPVLQTLPKIHLEGGSGIKGLQPTLEHAQRKLFKTSETNTCST